MRQMKKLLAAMLVAVMALAFSSTLAFAANDDGSITISNTTQDADYKIVKIFDATYADTATGQNVSYTYTKAENDALFTALQGDSSPFTLTQVGTTNTYNVAKKDGKTATDIGTFLKGLEDADPSPLPEGTTQTGNGGSLTVSNLAYGYYYISTSTGSAVTLDSALKNVTVIDKNQTSSFEKNIVTTGEDGKEVKSKVNEAGLNEDVDFKITVDATNYVGEDKVFKYVITDMLEAGMTYRVPTGATSPLTVTVNDEVVTPVDVTYYKADGATTTTDIAEAQKAVITLNWTADGTKAAAHKYPANSVINVTYKAFLDPAKGSQLTVGGTTDGNTNTAQVQYFKGPDDGTTPDEETPTGNLGTDKTDTFTTELAISKEDSSGNPLQGAEFTLTGPDGAVVITSKEVFVASDNGTYWELKDGTYTTQDPATPNDEDATKPKYDLSKYADYNEGDGLAAAAGYQKYSKTTNTEVMGEGQNPSDIKAMVGADGKVCFTGLGAGNYTLSESIVPAGYNPIPDMQFEITFDADIETNADGKVTGYTVTFDTDNDDIQVSTDNKLSLTVVNQTGTELPSTGGMGTTILYVIGAILVIGAGVYLVSRRRANKESNVNMTEEK